MIAQYEITYDGTNGGKIRLWASSRTSLYWLDNYNESNDLLLQNQNGVIHVKIGDTLTIVSGEIAVKEKTKTSQGIIVPSRTTFVLLALLCLSGVALTVSIMLGSIAGEFDWRTFVASLIIILLSVFLMLIWETKKFREENE